jgi:TP901 family phage tail tape measure protein
MAGTFDFTYTVGFLANTAALTSAINNVGNQLTTKPIQLSAVLPKVDTTQAQTYLNTINQMASSLDKVYVKQNVFTKAGEADVPIITRMVVQYKDALGNAATKWTELNAAQVKALQGQGYAAEKGTQTLFNPGKAAALLTSEINKNISAFDAMSKKSTEWSTRAEKMNDAERKGIQGTATALQEQINLYKQKVAAGDLAGAKAMVPNIQALNVAFEKQVSLSKLAANGIRSWGENIANAFKQTISYALSLGVVREAQKLLNDAIKYAIELNTEMVKIQVLQVEGAKTPEEINALADSYNQLAKAMGTTTLEIAKGSVEWLRQGRSIAETTELMKSSTMLSKLGNLSAAESTEMLTSTINSYQMSAAQAVEVVNKLVAVDNISATSAGELASALRYVAATAAEAGVSFDKLVSYIGVISSVTRLNAEQIGQAMKTMFTRMQDIKAGAIDSEGLGLNNVELALGRVNIKLRDTSTSFRPLSDVLEDVAAKWDTLNAIEQDNIAKAIAGVRQRNMFVVLMTNMNQALKLQTAEMNSAGLAADRYQIYLQSAEAAQNRLKASMQELYQTGIKSGLITGVLNATSKIIEFISSIGGLQTVLIALGTVILLLKWQSIAVGLASLINMLPAAINGTTALTAAFVSLSGAEALATGPIILITGLVAGLAAVIYYAATAEERHEKALAKSTDAMKAQSSEIQKLNGEYKDSVDLFNEFDALRNKAGKTTDDIARLTDIQNQLHSIFPELSGTFDADFNFLVDSKTVLQDIKDIENERLEIAKAKLALDAKQNIIDLARSVQDKKRDLDSQKAVLKSSENIASRYGKSVSPTSSVKRDINTTEQELKVMEVQFKNFYSSLGSDAQQALLSELDPKGTNKIIQDWADEVYNSFVEGSEKARKAIGQKKITVDDVIDKTVPTMDAFLSGLAKYKAGLEELSKARDALKSGTFSETDLAGWRALGFEITTVGDHLEITADSASDYIESEYNISFANMELSDSMQRIIDTSQAQKDAMDALKDTFDALHGEVTDLRSAMDEQANDGEINAETAIKLMESHSELAQYIRQEGDSFYLDSGAARDNVAALIEDQIATLNTQQSKINLAIASTGATAALMQESSAVAIQIAEYRALLALLNQPVPTPTHTGGGGTVTEQNKLLDMVVAMIKQQTKAEVDRLKAELDGYKKIIDAKKKIIDQLHEEEQYKDKIAEKNKSISRTQAELDALSLDNSEEAKAKRLELANTLAEQQKDLSETQEDESVKNQKDALDEEYKNYEEYINSLIGPLEEYLSEPGRIVADAMARIQNGGDSLYNSLISWNRIYGSGIDSDVVAAWNRATAAAAAYQSTVNGHTVLPSYAATGNETDVNPYYAEGIDNGLIGGQPMNSSDKFLAALSQGEGVFNRAQIDSLVKNIIKFPSITTPTRVSNSQSTGDVVVNFNVNGNMDKTVIPDLKNIANQVMGEINKVMANRGVIRTSDQYVT